MEKEIDFKTVPQGWALCFNNNCPKREKCLRHLAGRQVPAAETTGPAVYPGAWAEGDCKAFNTAETVNAAIGFSRIFRNVLQRHAPEMRYAIKRYLGGNGTYYDYLHGRRPLMPRQQAWIRKLFKDYGYTEPVEFDGYEDVFTFLW